MASSNRLKKENQVVEIKKELEKTNSLFIIHYKGLTVKQVNNLRLKLSEINVVMQVTKNSLMKIAIKDTIFSDTNKFFTGPSAIIYGNDPVSVAKILDKFSKENEKVAIIGAGMDNQILESKDVINLASMPSLDESRAKIIGIINAPAQKIANIAAIPARNLAMVLKAYANKSE